MELYLMQHGPNFSKDQDPEEGLTPEGLAQVRTTGRALKRLGVMLDAIVSSPKLRARHTAAIVASELGFAESDIRESPAIKAMAEPADTLEFLAGLAGKKSILVSGHQPSIVRVTSLLIGGGTVAFERGGVCRIDLDALVTGEGMLGWYLPPAVSSLLGA